MLAGGAVDVALVAHIHAFVALHRGLNRVHHLQQTRILARADQYAVELSVDSSSFLGIALCTDERGIQCSEFLDRGVRKMYGTAEREQVEFPSDGIDRSNFIRVESGDEEAAIGLGTYEVRSLEREE